VVERRVELRVLAQRVHARLDHERQERELHLARFRLGLHLFAELVEVGDVGLVVLRDVRDRDPAAVQVRRGQLADPVQLADLGGAELREVDLRWRRDRDSRDRHAGRGALLDHALHVAAHVVGRDARLRSGAGHEAQVDAHLARDAPHRRARVRQDCGAF
jgi:hypothetical protein